MNEAISSNATMLKRNQICRQMFSQLAGLIIHFVALIYFLEGSAWVRRLVLF